MKAQKCEKTLLDLAAVSPNTFIPFTWFVWFSQQLTDEFYQLRNAIFLKKKKKVSIFVY